MYRYHLFTGLIVTVLAGAGCGGLEIDASSAPSGEDSPPDTRVRSSELEEDEPDLRRRVDREIVVAHDSRLVEGVDRVPVAQADSSESEERTELDPQVRDIEGAEAPIYDISLRLDTAQFPEDAAVDVRLMKAESTETGDETEDGEPVPLPAEPREVEGEARDGEPVPLPAEPKSDERSDDSEDGEPVPLPAEWFSGLRETSTDDGSDDDEIEIFRAEDTTWVIFSNIERPDRHPDSELVVELSSAAWQSARYLSVDE